MTCTVFFKENIYNILGLYSQLVESIFLQIQTWKATTWELAMVKEQVMNTFKVGSIEEYVQQNQEDIIDLRYIMDAT